MKSTTIVIDGEKVHIEMSRHAEERCNERDVSEYGVYALIMKLGESLLELKDGEEFAVIDKELEIAIVCSINSREFELVVDVVTVISNEHIYISRGTKVFKLAEMGL